jgi:subtilisin-like proprotein convertase family protein
VNTRSSVSSIVAAVLLWAGIWPSVFANNVHVYTGNFNLPIIDKPGPGSEMTEAIIEITDHLVIDDLDVQINITHTNVFDLQLFLQSPANTRTCLNMYDFSKDFFKGQNYINTIFDDKAESPIEQAEAPFTGRFKPREGYFTNIFDGQDTYGLWRLQVYDMFDYDSGTLDSFGLIITAPEPATALLLTLGAGLLSLFRPRRSS